MNLRLFSLTAALSVVSILTVSIAAQKQSDFANRSPVDAVPCSNSLVTTAEATTILEGHNLYRRQLKLRDLVWDCRLAGNAQQWANKRETAHDEFTSYGESIFVATSPTVPVSAALARWIDERSNWNNETATCVTGKTCTHYTQMVWRNTTKIGCGLIRNGPAKWKTFLVCNYDPAGNTGGRAY